MNSSTRRLQRAFQLDGVSRACTSHCCFRSPTLSCRESEETSLNLPKSTTTLHSHCSTMAAPAYIVKKSLFSKAGLADRNLETVVGRGNRIDCLPSMGGGGGGGGGD
ncbi:hypothetical protein FHG87_000138 [Trinorchestia longiramus]|nr:hypothetical protein FHG87_000138 [Trinorchestia longiramus]